MPEQQALSFWQHLDDLRSVLFRIVSVILVAAIAAFCLMPMLFDNVLMAACHPDFISYRAFDAAAAACGLPPMGSFCIDIISTELTSQLMVQLSASCWTAFLVSFPIIIYLLWGFVEPALYPDEKKGIRKAFIFGNLMFYVGVAAAYFLVFPLTVRFLAEFTLSDSIRPMVTLDSYVEYFFTMMLIMGAVFELPLLAWLLGNIGILSRGFFSTYRRHAIVAILIIAAFITPTGDPFSLFIVFTPIYLLWELSASLVPATSSNHENS